jgi:hypothetical protein
MRRFSVSDGGLWKSNGHGGESPMYEDPGGTLLICLLSLFQVQRLLRNRCKSRSGVDSRYEGRLNLCT